jgi:hypothetical protein
MNKAFLERSGCYLKYVLLVLGRDGSAFYKAQNKNLKKCEAMKVNPSG